MKGWGIITSTTEDGPLLSLFANGIDYSPWLIIPTVLTGLALMIRQARQDRASDRNKAVEQWQAIALATQAEKSVVEGRLEESRKERTRLEVLIARLEESAKTKDERNRRLEEIVRRLRSRACTSPSTSEPGDSE